MQYERAMCSQFLQTQLTTLQIPKDFLDHSRISQVLHHIIHEFNHEEQATIFLYYLVEMSVDEIAALTKQPATNFSGQQASSHISLRCNQRYKR